MWRLLLACSDRLDDGTPTTEPARPLSSADGVAGTAIFDRLPGLWTGPATTTPLGPFPVMTVDIRPADAHSLWGRVDVDPDNALRFGLAVEDQGGPAVVYRNGGYFLGLLRDDRTVLIEADEDAAIYRFCHLESGCDYIDATWTFDTPDHLAFSVLVRGAPHVDWDATRAEERAVGDDFPDLDPLPADGPLPNVPTLELTVSWATPLAAEAHVWVVLATSPCADLACVPSRSSRAVAPAGATDAVVRFPEIHAGPYLGTAVLDRDRNFATTLFPGPDDGVSLPDRAVEVPATGTGTAGLVIFLGG